ECPTETRPEARRSSRRRRQASRHGRYPLQGGALPRPSPSPSAPLPLLAPSRASGRVLGVSAPAWTPRIWSASRRSPRDPPSPSHPLLRLAGDVREVGRLLELHVSAARRVAKPNQAFRWPRNRAVEEHVRISDISIVKETSVRGDVVVLFVALDDALVYVFELMCVDMTVL